MIRSSVPAKLISLIVSTVVVVGGMRLVAPDTDIEMEGGGEAVAARMGTSFEDMAVGTLTAEPVKETPLDAEQATETPLTQQMEETQATQADATEHPAPAPQLLRPAASPAPPTTAPAPDAVLPQPVPSTQTTAQLTPQLLQPVTPPPAQNAQEPLQPTAMQQTPTPAQPPQTIAANTPDSAAPHQSMRPERRDPEKAAKIAAARPKPAKPKVAEAAPQRGNAQRNNTQGAANSSAAQATTQGRTETTATQSGNAAASNYPGQVMRRIARVPKPRVNSRGTTVVAFAVSSSGDLTGLSVARSSGSAALDQAALRVISKAAPFPRPPAGARRSFSIRIKGR